jgi:hypothetical protein
MSLVISLDAARVALLHVFALRAERESRNVPPYRRVSFEAIRAGLERIAEDPEPGQHRQFDVRGACDLKDIGRLLVRLPSVREERAAEQRRRRNEQASRRRRWARIDEEERVTDVLAEMGDGTKRVSEEYEGRPRISRTTEGRGFCHWRHMRHAKKLELTNVTCKECGKHEDGTWNPEHTQKLRERSLCFTCDYWQDYVDVAAHPVDGKRCVRTPDGIHQTIGDENASGSRGHGGRRFVIVFDDGRRVESTNVWWQGPIPEHFRARLPPNATIEEPMFSKPDKGLPW